MASVLIVANVSSCPRIVPFSTLLFVLCPSASVMATSVVGSAEVMLDVTGGTAPS